ncbi:MAG: MBL fold metallo-hydrolase [Proteobacteria bacterium]|nr:MBL fold metallo-hydrolase [Pseudomonadota bacterium]
MHAQTALPDFVEPLPHGVYVVDTGFHRPRFDASFLIVDRGRAAFIDTGTNRSVPRLLAALDALGLHRDAVDYVIPTHVHLDHAGGVALLMEHLPGARVVVHPRGARHMIDPSRLMAGATAVYGAEEMERSYGDVRGVPAERVLSSADGMTLALGGRELAFLDTPGHARHHHAIWDAASQGVYTGDTFGLSYRELDTEAGPWIMPTSTPVQFDPVAMRRSIEKILALQPTWLYLTHYSRVGEPERLAALLLGQLDRMVALARSVDQACPPGAERHAALMQGLEAIHWKSLQAHGSPLSRTEVDELLALDLELNAQGIGVWLDRQRA